MKQTIEQKRAQLQLLEAQVKVAQGHAGITFYSLMAQRDALRADIANDEAALREAELPLAEPHSDHAAGPAKTPIMNRINADSDANMLRAMPDTIVMRFAKMTVRRELYDVVPDGDQWMVIHDGKAIEPCLTEAVAWEYAFNVVDCII